MGVLRFIHNLIGYNSSWRKRHALLHVIEQHIFTFPEEWEYGLHDIFNKGWGSWGSVRKDVMGTRICFLNTNGNLFFPSATGKWERLALPWGWETRLWFADLYLGRRYYRIKAKEEKAKKKYSLERSMLNDNQRLASFKPKLSAECRPPMSVK